MMTDPERLVNWQPIETAPTTGRQAPTCHFTPMEYDWADDWPNGQVEFWECQHCGHTKEAGRTPQAVYWHIATLGGSLGFLLSVRRHIGHQPVNDQHNRSA